MRGIFKWITDLYTSWVWERHQAAHRNGWNWAAGALLAGTPSEVVEDQIAEGSGFGEGSNAERLFDKGAVDAVNAWNNRR